MKLHPAFDAAVRPALPILLFAILLTGPSAGQVPHRPDALRVETVKIHRDVYGVPHVYGATNRGVLYGFGYAQAEDHLREMMVNYLRARGRLAEFLGVDDPEQPGRDTDFLDSDIANRCAKVWDIAESRYTQSDPDMRSEIECFAAGVNDYIAENQATLPAWLLSAAPVTGVDLVALGRWNAFAGEYALVRDEMWSLSREPWNSNQWVVGRSKSANGNVMVQIDPHVHWTIDCRMYEAHLHGGDYNFVGATYYGFPGFAMGHNDRFAISLTSNKVDTADVFVEILSKDLSQYLFDGQWYPVINEPVTLKVKGSAPVAVSRLYTHGGDRVILEFDGNNRRAYSYQWVSMHQVDLLTQLLKGDKARDLAGFKQSLAMLCGSKGNFAYGDRDGNVYYVYYGAQPLKNERVDWTRPVDGSTSLNTWAGGLIPFKDLPQIENPASDWVINCNVSPFHVTEGHGLVKSDYPCYLFHSRPDGSLGAANTFRQLRAMQLIAGNPSITIADMKAAVFDDYLITAEWLRPVIQASLADPLARKYVLDPGNLLDTAGQVLGAWDNRVNGESRGAALFTLFYEVFPQTLHTTYRPDPGETTLAEKVKLLYLLEASALWLRNKHGAVDVPWGAVHRIKRGGKAYPLGGGTTKCHSLRIAGIDSVDSNGVAFCKHGSAYIMTVVLSDPVRSMSAKPFGQSEDRASPHFADLTRLYCRNTFKPVWFELADILANLESTKVLTFRY